MEFDLSELWSLEHLPLEWLRLPARMQNIDNLAELPPRLRVAFLKGMRAEYQARDGSDLLASR